MKAIVFTLSIGMISSTSFAANWVSFYVETRLNDISSCSKDKSPADYMKSYDEMAIPYKILDEVKDKSGAVSAVKLFKSPGTSMETTMHFYKVSKDCERDYKKLFDAKTKALDEKEKKDGKAHEEYK